MSDQFDFGKEESLSEQLIRDSRVNGDGLSKSALGCIIAAFSFLLFAGTAGYGVYVWDKGEKAKKAKLEMAKSQDRDIEESRARFRIADLDRKLNEQREQEANQREQERQNRAQEDRNRQIVNQANLERDLKKLDQDERARRLGSLSKFERQQGMLALARVRAMGFERMDRLSPELIRRAAMIEPEEIAEMQRKLGEKLMKKN